MTETEQPLLIEKNDGIATLTFNRPRYLNAIDQASAEALLAALSEIERDAATRCVVLRGAGKAFMAGGDIGVMQRGLPDPRSAIRSIIEPFHEAMAVMARMPQPVIASIHGHAAGAGSSLAFATDLAVAATSAVFTLSYVGIAATPDGSATYSLPRLVGMRRAMEIALLAEPIPAPRALELGLVNRVVSEDALEQETYALARRLAQGPATAYAGVKHLVRQSLGNTLQEQLNAEEQTFLNTSLNPDFAEGLNAFLEKRRPRFGRE